MKAKFTCDSNDLNILGKPCTGNLYARFDEEEQGNLLLTLLAKKKISFHITLKREANEMNLELTIEYPETIPDALHATREQFEQEAKMAMAVKLFEMKRLSSGMAASLLNMDRVTFLLTLSRYGVSAIDETEDELEADFHNA